MKVLITGGTGLLGFNLQQTAPTQTNIISIYRPDEAAPVSPRFPSHPEDFTDLARISHLLSHFRPAVIIHTAAEGSLDWCEENPSRARAVNVAGTIQLAQLSSDLNAHFVFISSNAVFDGQQGNYSETDPVNPVNVYGQMKVEVEQWLSESNIPHAILRPNLMYGWPKPGGRDNQVTRVVKSLRSAEQVNAVTDTFFSPLSAQQAAQVVWKISADRLSGTFNIGGLGRLSLYQLSIQTANIFGLDSSLLQPMSVNDSPAVAARAIDTSFNVTKMRDQLQIEPLTVTDGLGQMFQHEPVPATS